MGCETLLFLGSTSITASPSAPLVIRGVTVSSRCARSQCGPGGCLLELTMQLGIIMVGKQALLTVWEMVLP